jgi:GR25 family glycosyltransferase involved in LPS biosynthesis
VEEIKINPFKIENWKAYYINLDKRTDRKELMESELARQGIHAQRFSALSDDNFDKFPEFKLGKTTTMPVHFGQKLSRRDYVKGEWGCAFSHYSILNMHLNSNSPKILAVFEDDAHFGNDFLKRLKYLEDNFDLDWDIFYLSSFCQLIYDKKTTVKHVWKIEDMMYGAGAMLINPASLPKILDLIRSYAPNVAAIDNLYNYLIPHLKMYCFIPGMVTQHYDAPGDIGNRSDPVAFIRKLFGPHIFAENLNDINWLDNLKLMVRHIFYSKTYAMRSFLKKKILRKDKRDP